MVGTRNARGPVTEEQFDRQWKDPAAAPEMKTLGFERPEQLGALFIGDADYLKRLTAGARPLIDDDPKRIEAPLDSQEESVRLIRSFTDAAAAQERFRRSPLIKRLWPERLLTASLPYFEFQNIINAHWYGAIPEKDLNSSIGPIHRLVTGSDLETPVLWLLGSDADVQRIVALAAPEELGDPERQFQTGIRFISERRFAEAAESLSRAEQLPPLSEIAFRLRVYALCMAGQTRRAQQLAEEYLAQLLKTRGMDVKSGGPVRLEPFWLWMKQTFGIDPLKSR